MSSWTKELPRIDEPAGIQRWTIGMGTPLPVVPSVALPAVQALNEEQRRQDREAARLRKLGETRPRR
jgi:hypothetical protein